MRQPKTGSFRPEARRARCEEEATQQFRGEVFAPFPANVGGFRFAELVDGRPVQPRDCIPGIICLGGAQR